MDKKLWFKAKRYGWGWYPVTWQGWLAIAIFLVVILYFSSTINDNSPASEVILNFVLPIAISLFLLLVLCYRTGEKPRWRWGGKDN